MHWKERVTAYEVTAETPLPLNSSAYEVKQKTWFFPLRDTVEAHLEHAEKPESIWSTDWTQ